MPRVSQSWCESNEYGGFEEDGRSDGRFPWPACTADCSCLAALTEMPGIRQSLGDRSERIRPLSWDGNGPGSGLRLLVQSSADHSLRDCSQGTGLPREVKDTASGGHGLVGSSLRLLLQASAGLSLHNRGQHACLPGWVNQGVGDGFGLSRGGLRLLRESGVSQDLRDGG